MTNRWQSKVILVLVLALVAGLGWRMIGCGGPLLPGNDTPKNNQVTQEDTSTNKEQHIPSNLPQSSLTMRWTDSRLEAKQFYYATWRNKPWMWFEQGQQTEVREVFLRETSEGPQVGLMPKTNYPGVLEEIIVKDDKLYAVGRQTLETGVGIRNTTRMLQIGEALPNTDTIKWYTVRTFRAEEYEDAKYLAFLGNTLLFYGQKNIYTIDPKSGASPELLKLSANMYPNVNYMKCSHDFCVALVNNYLPLMFSADTKWKTVPNYVYWVTVPTTTTYPFATETLLLRETFNQEFTTLVERSDPYLRDRIAIEKQRTAFMLRDRYVFWTCSMGNMNLEQRTSSEKIRAVTWANRDLLVVFPKRMVLVRKDKILQIPLPPEVQENNLELHRVTFQNNMLHLETTTSSTQIQPKAGGTQKLSYRLFMSPYVPGHAQSVCSQ